MRPLGTLFFVLLVISLAGCEERSVTIYSFGPANSCFPTTEPEKCHAVKAYDKVEIKVLGDRQEVTYVQKGLGLDESNTVFRRLENCKIIDRDTFSCDGLIRIDGQFVDTKVFGALMVSRSYWIFAYSHYFGSAVVPREAVQRFDEFDSWITSVIVFGALILLTILAAAS